MVFLNSQSEEDLAFKLLCIFIGFVCEHSGRWLENRKEIGIYIHKGKGRL